MSRATSNHVTVIRCDSPVCPTVGGARFMTASIALMARRQAQDARWLRLPAWTITDEESPRRKYDICPAEAPGALARQARRPEILAEQRQARKQQRCWEKQAGELRRVERQIARRARALAKIAKQVRRAERIAELARREVEAIVPDRVLPGPPSPDQIARGELSQDDCTGGELAEAIDATHSEGEFADDATWRDANDPSVQEELARVVEHITTSPPLPAPRKARKARTGPTTLDVIERILRARGDAMTVADIVGHAIGDLALPTQSKTPRTIVARDLAIDIKNDARGSRFVRTDPGIFMLREHWEKLSGAAGDGSALPGGS